MNIDFKDNNEKNLVIYDLQGRSLLSLNIAASTYNTSLNVSKFNTGIYFLQIESESGLYTKQIQIVRK